MRTSSISSTTTTLRVTATQRSSGIRRRTTNGMMKIAIQVDEGAKYYFGNITWKGNTKYPDSILNLVMGIHKGDVYDLDILNKKLGKQVTQEGGGISGSLYG